MKKLFIGISILFAACHEPIPAKKTEIKETFLYKKGKPKTKENIRYVKLMFVLDDSSKTYVLMTPDERKRYKEGTRILIDTYTHRIVPKIFKIYKMKKLILDYSTWRCGGGAGAGAILDTPNPNMLGKGDTVLLNDEGFMCCLGQFAKQINPNIVDNDILGIGEPTDVPVFIKDLNIVKEDAVGDEYFINSPLSSRAMKINDDAGTTPEEKIKLLKELFASYNYEIEVINQPTD